MKNKDTVYILKNDYEPEPGSIIYGVFTTREIAETAKDNLDELYGEGTADNCDIDQQVVSDDPTYL